MKDASPLSVPVGKSNPSAPHAHPTWDPDTPEDTLDFAALRQASIIRAQEASGKIWTDFNIHDPGVTYLEQTAFSLSELAYFGDHSVRDHLTRNVNILEMDGARPAFDAAALALFEPSEVLPGRPVTLQDLARCLSDIEGVDRVFVRRSITPGLIDLLVIPPDYIEGQSRPKSDRDPVDLVKDAFNGHRMFAIGLGLGSVTEAKPLSVTINGDIDVAPFADADAVAAAIRHRITNVLHGLRYEAAAARPSGERRRDVFDDPARVWVDLAADSAGDGQTDTLIAAIRTIPEVIGVRNLRLVVGNDASKPMRRRANEYFNPKIPAPGSESPFILRAQGSVLALDADRINREYRRLRAAAISRQGNRLDPQDWDTERPGRHRVLDRTHVDAMLPSVYRGVGTHQDGMVMAAYRQLIDDHLATLGKAITDLPDTFAAKATVDPEDGQAVARRIAVLDHLLALQGEMMPEALPAALHALRSHRQRAIWSISWREAYLADLPRLNRYQGTTEPKYGLAARLSHLTDMRTAPTPDPASVLLRQGGIRSIGESPAPNVSDGRNFEAPDYPTGSIVLQNDTIDPFGPAELIHLCPWLSPLGSVSASLLRHAACQQSYGVVRVAGRVDQGAADGRVAATKGGEAESEDGRWYGLLECPDGRGLYTSPAYDSYEDALNWAQRSCNSWIALNNATESLTLIEDMALRADIADFTPAVGWAVIPGFSVRSIDPGFRAYVETQIIRAAPAHVHIRTVWLDPDDAAEIREIALGWYNGQSVLGPKLRSALSAIAARQGA